uniref:Uncharacterized protein n=1 Tax=Lepeophtheirus salmonis TaxID=72036 RepID=A0A0K2VJ09_LEPSM
MKSYFTKSMNNDTDNKEGFIGEYKKFHLYSVHSSLRNGPHNFSLKYRWCIKPYQI